MKKQKNWNSFFAKIIIIIFTIIFLICLYLVVQFYMEYSKSNKEQDTLIKDVVSEDVGIKERKIDWEKLKSINQDIIGWIKIDNTKIDYPILKSNNSYYLNHSYNKQYNPSGSIFIMDRNLCVSKETIIYGHNRMNGTMFSELSKYMNEEFLNSHRVLYIYTPEKNYKGEIFSIYSINIYEEKNNTKDLSFEKEISYYKNKSEYKTDIKNIEKIVKLSTCSYLNNRNRITNQRYYVVASIKEM